MSDETLLILRSLDERSQRMEKKIDENSQRIEKKVDDFAVRHEAQDDAIHKGLLDQIVKIQLERSVEQGARKMRMKYISWIGGSVATGVTLLGAWWDRGR